MLEYRRLAASLAIPAVLLAGCTAAAEESAGPRIIQPGAPGEPNRELTPEELEDLEPPPHNDADVRFMHAMIAHHEQALRMTALVPDHTDRDDLPLFAERMDISQTDEIDLMRRWLEARGEETATHDEALSRHDAESRYGMLTDEQLEEMASAAGPAFDRLFLERMVAHHLGALKMVEDLYRDGGGEEAEIAQFTLHVEADQGIELSRMEGMLATLDQG